MKKVLFVFGTRPEAIKLAPVIRVFRDSAEFETRICVTAQHREMLDQVLDFFSIVPDHDLSIMQPGQSLADLTANALTAIAPVLKSEKPDLVFVQGDTTTVLVTALAAYYQHIPVAHVEAGLRSFDKLSPFPEEINRKLTTAIADLHFAPTKAAAKNLAAEGIKENVYVTGNTVIDALLHGLEILDRQEKDYGKEEFSFLKPGRRLVLITCHRRESFGEPFAEICRAIGELASGFPDVVFVYPVHLNPNIREHAGKYLSDRQNVFLIDPVPYPQLIWLMKRSHMVLTDSGGIQEEAPTLGKPVLVLREVTERQEGIEAGTAKLVGRDFDAIVDESRKLLTDEYAWGRMANAVNPYGDGKASEQILGIVRRWIR